MCDMKRFHPEDFVSESVSEGFLLDKNRIIATGAFRKLAHKTQVFANDEFINDYHRTRLTHTIEVAHFSLIIAKQLAKKTSIKLAYDLTESIALAHDMGHPPFGHVGEIALNQASLAGFDHNAQVLRILTVLERRHDHYRGLNLQIETLDGILKHNGKFSILHSSIVDLPELKHINFNKNGRIEAQIAAIADDIAYCFHDLEDGLREGFFKVHELDIFPIVKRFKKAKIEDDYLDDIAIFRPLREQAVFFLIEQLVKNTYIKIQQYGIQNAHDACEVDEMIVVLPDEFQQEILNIKRFLRKNMYDQRSVMSSGFRGQLIISNLYKTYSDNLNLLPKNWALQTIDKNEMECSRIICDYISGMTDRYILKEYTDLFI